jgi:glycosyltransferase involved in cell wall biosynthesis
MPKIAVIVPAYNEEASIISVVSELSSVAQQNNLSIVTVVINDCSTDSTGKIINSLDCVALHIPINIGIGGAVQTGFKYALENGFDFAIQVDGDGQHPAGELPKLIHAQQQKAWNITIGSRFISRTGFQSSALRRAGINYFKHLIRLLVDVTIADNTSGFRMFDRKALQIVCDYYPDEYPEPEAIILFRKNHLTIGETQVDMVERRGGNSSIRGASSAYYMLKVTLSMLFTFIKTKSEKQIW